MGTMRCGSGSGCRGRCWREQMEYWRKQLAGVEALELPTDHARPAVMSQRGAADASGSGRGAGGGVEGDEPAGRGDAVHDAAGGIPGVAGRYSGQRIVVGTPVANRKRVETEGLIGFFVNTLVLRTEVEEEAEFPGVLGRVREVTLGAYGHQDVPFEKLVEELQPERDLSRQPLFQVMLVLQNLGIEEEGRRKEKGQGNWEDCGWKEWREERKK